jgi:CheY-like chemotaxis protein
MKNLRILIVEDEPLVSMVLQFMIENIVSATFVIQTSVAAAEKAIQQNLDFAFLDVEVTNGKTFEIAQKLKRKQIPYVFVSGSRKDDLPHELQESAFITKPFHPAQIEEALKALPC